ncbi:MAG: hypothetical protein BGO06_03620 [Shinella sp. 65-6]|nr:MAG: hypothetical protein BGO06_03620 [Shinella sp. 65-6]
MNVNFPGLIRQVLPSGTVIYRVRPKGQHGKRIQIDGVPGTEEFNRQYALARRGVKPDPMKKPSEEAIPQSIGWLVQTYLEYLDERVKAGTTSAKTVKKKRNLLARLIVDPDRKMFIPREKLIEMQDKMAASPAQADAFIEAVAVMFDWAIERKHIKENTARGIKSVYRKGDGATHGKRLMSKPSSPSTSPGQRRTWPCQSCCGPDAGLRTLRFSGARMNARSKVWRHCVGRH